MAEPHAESLDPDEEDRFDPRLWPREEWPRLQYTRDMDWIVYAIAIKAFFHEPETPMIGEHIFLTDIFADATTVTGTLASDAIAYAISKKGSR